METVNHEFSPDPKQESPRCLICKLPGSDPIHKNTLPQIRGTASPTKTG